MFGTAGARADVAAPVPERQQALSSYERESVQLALTELGATLDPHPEGKVIESVEVIALEVFEPRDPLPRILNGLHVKTRRGVITREVLLRVGQPYDAFVADETARNLRKLPQLSLVLCFTVRGTAPTRVRFVVLTKDVWSLRLSWDIAYTAGGLERLVLNPTETNLLGTHTSVAARLVLQPESYALGLRHAVPRVFGSRVAYSAEANIVMNRRSGSPEGSFGAVSVGQPLFSARTEWAWNVAVAWRNEVTRRYVNGRLGTFDAAATPQNDRIPFEYRSDLASAGAEVTRSFGRRFKSDVSVGLDVSRRAYRTFDLSGFDPAAAAEFVATKVPVSDTRATPYVELREYTSDFLRVLDFETLGLQEDYRLGHDVVLRLYPSLRELGSSRAWIGVRAAAQYTVALGDGLARASVRSVTEAEAERLSDAQLEGSVRVVTPRLGFGRVVFDAYLLSRYRNYLNRTTYLGGEGRLRGYPSSYFVGKDLVVANMEFRTRPIEVLSCQLGAAAFYDAGDAFDGFDALRPRQSVGAGLRVLFPQFDRVIFRADLGFPIAHGPLPAGVGPASFFVTFDQAFALPAIAP